IWKYAFYVSLICAAIIGGSLTWYYWISNINIAGFEANNTGYGMSPKLALFPTNSALKLASFGLTCGCADLLVNAITCLGIFYKKNQNNVFNKAAMSLMIITLIEFVAQILVFFAEGAMYLLMQQNIYSGIFIDIYFAMCWITDLSVLSKPYTLLFMSRNVRKAFFHTYHIKSSEYPNRIFTVSKPPPTISIHSQNKI
uniref:Serpentine receptor class gamma n=1 Tax=Panagrolaimus sp. JU765 TaxID=591449 RepID=A0AC34REE6_9BILA